MATTKVKYPIWYNRPYYIPVKPYTIRTDDDTVIYSGYAQSVDETQTEVNVYFKSILANYLSPYFDCSDNGDTTQAMTQNKTFRLYVGDEAEARYEMTVWYDWTYSYDYMNNLSANGGIISQPINYHWDRREHLTVSFFESTDLNSWVYHYVDANGDNEIEITYNQDYFTSTLCMGRSIDYGITEYYITNDGVNVMEWKPEDERCGYGALTYVNSLGGWDTFLLECPINRKQDIDRQKWSTGTGYFLQAFDEQYIIKSIFTTYSTVTGWLSDEQSKLMYDNLFASPVIYFQDFTDTSRTLIPVYLTSTSWDEKTFRNGKKLIQYELQFKESHTKLR